MVKNLPANPRDAGWILVSKRSPREGNSNPLKSSCLRNPVGQGAWQATDHRVTRVGHDLVTKQPPINQQKQQNVNKKWALVIKNVSALVHSLWQISTLLWDIYNGETGCRIHENSLCVCARVLRPVWLLATPWTVAHQAPLSMGFSRQEYWSRLPSPTPGDQTSVSCVSCIGRQILYHWTTWEVHHQIDIRCLLCPRHYARQQDTLLSEKKRSSSPLVERKVSLNKQVYK